MNVTINDFCKINDYAKEPVGVNLGWLKNHLSGKSRFKSFLGMQNCGLLL